MEFDAGADLPCSKWINHLQRLSSKLQMLCSSTEDEFLSIGAGLHDFHNRAGEISKMSSSAVSVISGSEIVDAIEGLRRMLNRMNDYLSQSREEFQHGIEGLQHVLHNISSVHEPLDGFKKIVKTLKVLSTVTKIECVRFYRGETGFTTLAEDIEKLALLINAKSAHMLTEIRSLSNLIDETLSKAFTLEATQQTQAGVILEDTQASLISLTEINNTSSATASNIAISAETISHNIGEVVTAMQFHDITRQQMEHAKETLDDLIRLFISKSNSEGRTSDAYDANTLSTVSDTCKLQQAQLHHSKEEFVTAVNSIIENLRDIGGNVVAMSEQTRKMTGTTDQVASSVLSKIESGISSVTSSLRENTKAISELLSAMNSVGSTTGNLSVFVNDIEEIGAEIELIAVNARIKAAHTGEEGAALGVIAETIQKLSLDARFQTTGMSDSLRKITTGAEQLSIGSDSEINEKESEMENMVGDLKVLLDSLHRINAGLIPLLSSTDEAVRTLSRDIDGLGEIGADCRELAPVSAGADNTQSLDSLAERYTMHSERKVHRNLMDENIHEPMGSHISKDMGDNVELF
jgi:methyl-accepting chemotaxis protein